MNWKCLRNVAVIALTVLTVCSACSASRHVSAKEQVRVESAELRDSSRVEREVVAVHDTIMEVTTIHIQTNEAGDTLKVAQVTERDRVRDRTGFKVQDSRVAVKRDTVYVEKRDSVLVQTNTNLTNGTNRPSGFIQALRWIFWILVCVIVLVIIIKVTRLFNVLK